MGVDTMRSIVLYASSTTSSCWYTSDQGLKLVHFSAQLKPCWSRLSLPPCLIDWGKVMHPTYPQNMLTLSQKVDECKPLPRTPRAR